MWRVQLVLVLAVLTGYSAAITTDQEAAVRDICIEVITDPNNNLNMIAGLVRLIFHDCVGGCDGCINPTLQDSTGDIVNGGLTRYINALESRYIDAQAAGITSRADYWALCAAEAVRQGRGQVRRATSLVVPVKYGRSDCTTNPPFTTSTTNAALFPNPRLGIDHVLEWCASTFSFGSTECVALMGAHTLGRARRGNSGYTGPWVARVSSLDNDYYIELLNSGWVQENVAGPRQTARWQYVRARENAANLLMLNTDMCLLKNIIVNTETGEGPPTVTNVVDSDTAADVRRYAADDTTWAEEFGEVFGKMIEQGASGLQEPQGSLVPLPPVVRGGGGGGGGQGK